MTYPDPTNEQMLVIAAAALLPLAWAFTRHGNARTLTLAFWLPWLLFVARVTYMNRIPTAPLEARLRWALIDMSMDPMTIVWPAFVLLTFGLIRFFGARRERREANARSTAFAGLPPQPPYEPPAASEPWKRCLGCNRRLTPSVGTCPHCGYGFRLARAQAVPARSREQPSPQPEWPGDVSDAAVVERIRMLGALRDDGLLTEEEFQEKKAGLLTSWPRPPDAPRPNPAPVERADST